MSGEENLGNLRVYIHELDREMICPCKVFIICEEHRTLNGLVSVSATARVKIYHVPPDVRTKSTRTLPLPAGIVTTSIVFRAWCL